MKLKLDENLSRHLQKPLEREGFDVDTAEAETGNECGFDGRYEAHGIGKRDLKIKRYLDEQ